VRFWPGVPSLRRFKTDECVANPDLGRCPNEKERDQVCVRTGFWIETSVLTWHGSGYFRPVAICRLVSRTATAGSEDRFLLT
jgi:hypothetical protein